MRYLRILQAAARSPWAIEDKKGQDILAFLLFAAKGGKRNDEELAAIVAETDRPAPERADAAGAIAVLRLGGVIVPRQADVKMTSEGQPTSVSAEGFPARIKAAVENPEVAAVVIDIDSPGGNVLGVPEAFAEVRKLRGGKPIVGVANHLAASAAYWLASAMDEIVATPSAEIGSIGVFTFHQDISRFLEAEGVNITLIKAGQHKAEEHPAFPLTDEARAFIQGRVDDYYGMFVRDVAKARGMSVADVRGDRFGGGRAISAKDALEAGMIDRIDTLQATIERLSKGTARQRSGRSAGLARRRMAIA